MKGTKSTEEQENIERLKYESELSVDCIKEVSILFDKNKKQYSIKIPKEIVDIFNIKKGDKFRFVVEIKENQEEIKNKFEIIK